MQIDLAGSNYIILGSDIVEISNTGYCMCSGNRINESNRSNRSSGIKRSIIGEIGLYIYIVPGCNISTG